LKVERSAEDFKDYYGLFNQQHVKYIAICFADEKFEKTRKRYADELRSKNIFEQVIEYTTEDFDEDFLSRHKTFMENNTKGYGYYIWKPYFILKALAEINDGDVLIYGDAGNDMPGSKEECLLMFNKILTVTKGIKIIASKQGWTIRWIKSDLYLKMGWKSFLYAFKPMAEAGRLVIQKNDETKKFIAEWLDYATGDYHFLDNSPSKLPNLPFFIEHRNDQSIFSILFHKYKGTLVNFGEVWRAKRIRY